MLMEGKTVKWNTVNGVVSGTVLRPVPGCDGDWIVSLGNGMVVIVNESSFINE